MKNSSTAPKKEIPSRLIRIYLISALVIYFILSIYSISQVQISSFQQLITFLFLLPISNVITSSILIGLILLSVFLYYRWMGYNFEIGMYGVLFALFSYIGFAFLLVGIVMLNRVESSSVISSAENSTSFLSSGIFGNSIGTIGLALALISIGLTSYDKIHTYRTEEEILLRLRKKEYHLKNYQISLNSEQIKNLSLIWLIAGILIGFYISFSISTIPFLTSLAFIVSIIWIGSIGIMLIIYAFYLTKVPPPNPEHLTFGESVQKIRDEFNYKNEEKLL